MTKRPVPDPAKQALAILRALERWCVAGPARGFRVARVDGRSQASPIEVDRRSQFADEKDIILTARPAIPISQIIATIDAVRGSFPTVAIGISR
jgi:hypothetical protein